MSDSKLTPTERALRDALAQLLPQLQGLVDLLRAADEERHAQAHIAEAAARFRAEHTGEPD